MRLSAFSILLLTCTGTALAGIYRYTDPNGQTVFTSQPPEGVQATEVNVQTPNTLELRTPALPATRTASPPPVPTAAYSQLQLQGIPEDGTLRANSGSFVVSARLKPALQPGHRLRLLLDGQPAGPAGTTSVFQLTDIDRGEHQLQLQVLTESGQLVQSSPPLTFTLQRVSLYSPARH